MWEKIGPWISPRELVILYQHIMNDISINLQAVIEGRILLYVFWFAFCAALVSSSCDLINTNTHLLHTEDISKVVKDYKQFCKQSTQCMKTPSCWILSNPCIHTNDRGINTLYKGMQTKLDYMLHMFRFAISSNKTEYKNQMCRF